MLSAPHIVEAIEDLFVPVFIYNNRSGADARILKSFHEAAWNYPVTRIIDSSRRDVVPRSARWQDGRGLVRQITSALKRRKKSVPAWLDLLALNHAPGPFETAVFGMS